MNKLISGLLFALLVVPAYAGVIDPQKDTQEFQSYFKEKFPKVPFDDFANGLYALPGAEARRAEWEDIMTFPPYELDLAKGKAFWDKNGLAGCFKNGGAGIAVGYPYWDAKKKSVRTVELDINACLKKNGKDPIKNLKKGMMASVVSYFRNMSRGQRINSVVPDDPAALKEYAYGRTQYWAKRGQLNFSCANCHVGNAGKRVGGNLLSAGLGHGMGFPVYRSKWGGLGTIHRRYGGCNKQVRAAPLKAQSREYRALEWYEAVMNKGLPLTAPSQRF